MPQGNDNSVRELDPVQMSNWMDKLWKNSLPEKLSEQEENISMKLLCMWFWSSGLNHCAMTLKITPEFRATHSSKSWRFWSTSSQWTWIIANGGKHSYPIRSEQQRDGVAHRAWSCLCKGLCLLRLLPAYIWTFFWGLFTKDQNCEKEIPLQWTDHLFFRLFCGRKVSVALKCAMNAE